MQKSYGRYLWNQHRRTGDVSSDLDQFLSLNDIDSYKSRDLDKACVGYVSKETSLYQDRVFPSTWLGRECGNMYTGSLYACLAALVSQKGSALDDTRALLFSYGSGLAATALQVNFSDSKHGDAHSSSLDGIAQMLDLPGLLDSRVEVSPEEYIDTLEQRREAYGTYPMTIPPPASSLREGSYFLVGVDARGRRQYEKK